MSQETLFSALPTMGSARVADPITSRQAAERMEGAHLGNRQFEVLHALVDAGGSGTLDDVVARTGRYPHTTSRRLTDLEQAGAIRKTDRTRAGVSGRQQIVWDVVQP